MIVNDPQSVSISSAFGADARPGYRARTIPSGFDGHIGVSADK